LFKILILSNGHGEDLSGSLIAKQFVKSGYSVHALPIVGIGNHYEKEKIKIIGKTKEFSTGGIGYNSFKGRLTEIFGGEIFYLLKRLYLSYKIRKKYDYYTCYFRRCFHKLIFSVFSPRAIVNCRHIFSIY